MKQGRDGEVGMIEILIYLAMFAILWASPIVIIYCIKPRKSLKDGFRDWIDESADDI